jgi:hypothetical protein
MFVRSCAAAICCAVAAGCATIPTERNDGISIARVADHVKCELGQALATNSKLQSWAGVITLTLELDLSGSVMPSTTLMGPFATGAYGVGLTAGTTLSSTQTHLVTAYFPVWQVEQFAEHCPEPSIEQLEDRLGLKEWVTRALDAGTEEGLVFNDTSKAIGYTIEFDLDVTAGITPSFTLTRASGQVGATVDRKTKHTLEIALTDAHIQPPRQVVVFRPRKTPSGAPDIAAPPQRTVVVTRATPLSDDAKRRLDTIMQQLILKNLRLRGF